MDRRQFLSASASIMAGAALPLQMAQSQHYVAGVDFADMHGRLVIATAEGELIYNTTGRVLRAVSFNGHGYAQCEEHHKHFLKMLGAVR